MADINNSISKLTGFSYRHGKIISIFTVIFALVAPFLIKGLQFETTSASQSTADDPMSQIYVENLHRFGDSDTLIIYLEFSGVSSEIKNTFTDSLEKELSSWSDINYVDTKPFDFNDKETTAHLIRTIILNSEPHIRQQFAAKFTESGLLRELRKTKKKLITLPDPTLRSLVTSDILNIREILLPFYENRMGNFKFSYLDGYFDSEDGEARLIFVQPSRPSEDADFCAEFISRLERTITRIIGSMEKADSIQYALTGKYSVIGESMQILKQDMRYITLVAIGLIFMLLCIAFRNVRAVFICFLPLCISVLAALTFARFFFNPLNYLALGFLAIILGLGVDVLLHCTGRFYQLNQDSASYEDAVKHVMKEAGPPVVIGLTTTAIAFLCLTFAQHPPLIQFGFLTSSGLIITLFISLFLFPAAVKMLGPKSGENIKPVRFRRFPNWVGRISFNKPLLALGIVFTVLMVSLLLLKNFSFHMDFFTAFPKNLESLNTSQKVSERFGQSFFMNSQLTLEAEDLETAMTAQKILDEKLIHLIKENKIASFQSASFFKAYSDNETIKANLQQVASPITKNRALFFAHLDKLKFQKDPAYETYYDMLESAVSIEKTARRDSKDKPAILSPVNKFVATEDNDFFLQTYIWPVYHKDGFLPIEKSVLSEIASLDFPNGIQFHMTGTYQVFEKVGNVVRADFFRVSLLSLLVIPIVIFIFFRSVRNVLLSLLPLTAAIPMTLALVVLTKTPFSPFQIGVAAILIGIGIDDAVHLLTRTSFHEKRRIEEVLPEIGPVITLTSFSTMIGFGALIFSRNQAVSSMGFVITIGVFLSLVFTIVLLPATLVILNRKK